MPLQLDDLAALDAPTREATGLPLMLPVDAVDEDPDQPRREFDDKGIEELADTIRLRGVRQPISVRPNPQAPGRWMLNFGARRLRASKLAGMTEIPAFVDDTADGYDQVIENEQREGLRPLELALFIQRRLVAGDTQAEIARRMGKSKTYVTYATALIDPPDWLLAAYREGRCRGLKELHELRRLAEDDPQAVQAWATSREVITRQQLATLRAAAAEDSSAPGTAPTPAPPAAAPGIPNAASVPRARLPKSAATARPLLCANLDGKVVTIDTDHRPPKAGQVLVRRAPDTLPRPVEASRLLLLGFDVSGDGSTV